MITIRFMLLFVAVCVFQLQVLSFNLSELQRANPSNSIITGYVNPVIRGEVADPSIIRIADTYFAVGTSSEWAPFFPVYSSKNLTEWKLESHVFNTKPSWTSNSFWAPEFFYHNNLVYCYYTARRSSDGVSFIGVATAESPVHEFTDHGILVEYGSEAIDAFVINDNGQLYISWKAYGLDQRPIELLGSKLSADGLRLEGSPFSLLRDDERIGMEGQSHYKIGDYYYLIYAAKSCCGFNSDYDVRVARSRDFKGPYEKFSGNPILYGGGNDFISVGHGTLVETPEGRMFYMCHGYVNGDNRFCGRQPVMFEMEVDKDEWLTFKDGPIASLAVGLPLTSSPQSRLVDFLDSFKSKALSPEWTWNYPFNDVSFKQKNARLYLTGRDINNNRNGAALCVRPESPDYTFETQTLARTEGFNGLTIYGDNDNLLAWGLENQQLVLKMINSNTTSVLAALPFKSKKAQLKIEVSGGCMVRVYYKSKAGAWLSPEIDIIDVSSLNRWDRVFRPGLIHTANYEKPSEFSYFHLKHKRTL